MRPRGQTLVAALVLAAVAVGGLVLQRAVGVRAPAGMAPGRIGTGAWFCPHGGGRGWSGTIFVANPGRDDVTARVRTLGEHGEVAREEEVVVPAAGSRAVEVSARERGNGSVVEFFGGWVAAGWVLRAAGGGEPEVGVAAEPCLPDAGRTWTLTDGDLETDADHAYLVVMNPFAEDAVFSVITLTEADPPGGAREWQGKVLPGGRSVAFDLGPAALGEATVAGRVDVSIGRVAAASLGVTADVGIRSAVGHLGAPRRTWLLPGGGDLGTTLLPVANPGDEPATFGAAALVERGLQPAGQLQEQLQKGASAATYELTTGDPSTLLVEATVEGPGVAVVRRTRGVSRDVGATSGSTGPGRSWVVLPATGDEPHDPEIVLGNPGAEEVMVTLTTLPIGGGEVVTKAVTIPPGASVSAPKSLLEGAPDVPVLAVAETGSFVPAASSYSQGREARGGFAVSAGVPIPETAGLGSG